MDLRKALGLEDTMSTYFLRAPHEYWQTIGTKPQPYDDNVGEYDFIHAFFGDLNELDSFLDILLSKQAENGLVWISLPDTVNNADVEAYFAANKTKINDKISIPGWYAYRIDTLHQ